MISEVIFSLCMNISILAVIAAFLTERTFFRGLLFVFVFLDSLQELDIIHDHFKDRSLLAVLFITSLLK